MESLQQTKRRIKSVHNINQITKAMELVAATKMRRSQEIALASRAYAFTALDILANLSGLESAYIPPLMEKRPVKKTLLVLIASDKGLAGSFNSAVIRNFENFLKNQNVNLADSAYTCLAVGLKAKNYLEKRGATIVQSFLRTADFTELGEVEPLANAITSGFLKKSWDAVIVFSTNFRTALRQEVLRRQIFPVDVASIRRAAEELVPESGRFSEFRKEGRLSFFKNKTGYKDYLIEPSPEEALSALIPHLVLMQIYHIILEANASEHAARRTAMKSASDNASELNQELNTIYNKSRQAAITKEILEITAGVEALK